MTTAAATAATALSLAFFGTTTFDECLNRVYDPENGFKYSLPRNLLEGYCSGIAFDNKTAYTEEEKRVLLKEIKWIFENKVFKEDLPIEAKKIAVMTAGAPGAGKTWKMRQDLEEQRSQGTNYAYIDPDDVVIKTLTMWKTLIESKGETKEGHYQAYNFARPASNAATHLILPNLIREGLPFYFGTTSTGAPTKFFHQFLKDQGYHIRLIHISAPDDVRWASIAERDKSFVQTTEEDTREKGKLLPQRIMDAYLTFADDVEFYYRGALHEDAQLAATWIRQPGKEIQGKLTIVDQGKYEQIKGIHNTTVDTLDKLSAPEKEALKWESTVEAHSVIT